MKRLIVAFAAAAALASGLAFSAAPVQAQNPTESCQACRTAFTACMAEAATPAAAAACRATATACVEACLAE